MPHIPLVPANDADSFQYTDITFLWREWGFHPSPRHFDAEPFTVGFWEDERVSTPFHLVVSALALQDPEIARWVQEGVFDVSA